MYLLLVTAEFCNEEGIEINTSFDVGCRGLSYALLGCWMSLNKQCIKISNL